MRPLLLEYPDDWSAVDKNDEYFFGGDLIVAPVTKDDDTSRGVYLPRGVWYDYWTDHRCTGPTNVEAVAPMERIPLFVRGGAIIPSQQDLQYTDQAPIDPLTFDVYPDGTSSRQEPGVTQLSLALGTTGTSGEILLPVRYSGPWFGFAKARPA